MLKLTLLALLCTSIAGTASAFQGSSPVVPGGREGPSGPPAPQ
ncbi:MAG TPA: hypothetical protein VF548_05765 [Allosphingosinicella sp.]